MSLFQFQGQPLRFKITPGYHRKQIKGLIQGYGGIVTSDTNVFAILVAPEHPEPQPGLIDCRYIVHCIIEHQLLNPGDFEMFKSLDRTNSNAFLNSNTFQPLDRTNSNAFQRQDSVNSNAFQRQDLSHSKTFQPLDRINSNAFQRQDSVNSNAFQRQDPMQSPIFMAIKYHLSISNLASRFPVEKVLKALHMSSGLFAPAQALLQAGFHVDQLTLAQKDYIYLPEQDDCLKRGQSLVSHSVASIARRQDFLGIPRKKTI